MLSTLCISFLALASVSQVSHPEEVVKVLKNRLTHQWQQENTGITLDFDNPNCASQGTYLFNEEQMILSANHEHWRGRLEVGFTDLLEGRAIPLDRVRPNSFRTDRLTHTEMAMGEQTLRSSNSTWKKWIPWTLAIAGVATGAYILIERERHIKQLQGLKISF